MEQLLAALDLPSTRYDAPLDNTFRYSSENPSVAVYDNDIGWTERGSGLNINSGTAKTLDTVALDVLDYPPDSYIPTLVADQSIRLPPPHELSRPPPSPPQRSSPPLPMDAISGDRVTSNADGLYSSSLETHHQTGRQSVLLSMNDSPGVLKTPSSASGSPIRHVAELVVEEEAFAVDGDRHEPSRALSTSKRSSLPALLRSTLFKSSSSRAPEMGSKNNTPSFDIARPLPSGDDKTNMRGSQEVNGISDGSGQVRPGDSAMPDLSESGNDDMNAHPSSSTASSPMDPLTPAGYFNVPPEFGDYSVVPTDLAFSDLALQPNEVVNADLFSAWSSFLRDTAHPDSTSLSRRSSPQSPRSIRSGSQVSSMTTSLNQSLPSNSLSSARATIATSNSSHPPTTIPQTAWRLETGSRTPSEFSLLSTPSSSALSELRQTSSYTSFPAPMPSHQKKHRNRFFGLFGTKPTRPRSNIDIPMVTPQANVALMAVSPASVQRSTSTGNYSPFRYLTSKRVRNMSSVSIEAQDGTEVFHCTFRSELIFTDHIQQSNIFEPRTEPLHSQPSMQVPPLRDPMLAIQEWRHREVIEAPSKVRRRRPGVVFDVGEDPMEAHHPRPRPRRALSRSDPN